MPPLAPTHNAPAPAPGTAADQALPRLIELYGPRLYALATRLCGNAADAEDATQDALLQAYRKWHTFKGDASPGTWLYTIATRACLARTRRQRAARRRMPPLSQLMPWSDATSLALADRAAPGPVARTIEREAANAVHHAVLGLPEAFRVPLVLKEMLELPIDDVAAALNLKPATVKTRVHRARLLLRKAILDRPRMPAKPAQDPAYDKRVCLDLLKAKLDAMDRGRGCPIPQPVICDRCRAVFAELDLAQDACARLAEGDMPARLRRDILRAIRDAEPVTARPPGTSKARAARTAGTSRSPR